MRLKVRFHYYPLSISASMCANGQMSIAVLGLDLKCLAEADLRMFSIFGRTGAPRKRGLTKAHFFHFLQHGNEPEILK